MIIKIDGKLVCGICFMDAELVESGCGRSDCPYRDGANDEVCHLCGKPMKEHNDVACREEVREDRNGEQYYGVN